ncbi:MAG TPA: DUF6037 family protein [Smithellaceae bacterium]|nr:MAG: hypothetical protein BWX92_02969 [Deltaproteobacteria bacterium ADurb.Bin135]HPL66620.1 DUF6037 family protein [Smithellaceae bacterium]
MKLDGLKPLYRSMKDQEIDRYRFGYTNGKASFDVFFFIDESPFILLFGVKGDKLSFEIEIFPGFQINLPLCKETYNNLCMILGLKYDPSNRFSPKDFFSQFNISIPSTANKTSEAKPHEFAKYYPHLEEANKVYFLGWRDNQTRNEHVTTENLLKTRKLLGVKVSEMSLSKNFSSCWTDDPAKAKKFFLP